MRREELAIVPQIPFLFAGSIAENVAFGREWITGDEIEAAVRVAQSASFVRRLPGGADYELQERGQPVARSAAEARAGARAGRRPDDT